MCHLSAELRQLLPVCQLQADYSISIVTCEVSGGADTASCNGEQPWQAFHNDWCHLSRFHLLFKVVDKCPECTKTLCHQDVFLKKCFWHLTSWQYVSVSFLPMVRQGDRLWLVSQQVVRLHDWHSNVCWHGDQPGLLEQLVLMKHKVTIVLFFASGCANSHSLQNTHSQVC